VTAQARTTRIDVDAVVDFAMGASSDPGAMHWADKVLRRHLREGRALAVSPELAARVGLPADRAPTQAEWLLLAPRLAKAVGNLMLPLLSAKGLSVAEAVEEHGRQDERRLEREDRARAAVAEARSAPLEWHWSGSSERSFSAKFSYGKLDFTVTFMNRGEEGWERGWTFQWKTLQLLKPFVDEATNDVRGTGLFPQIERALREITADFFAKAQPERLFIRGADAKRNRHNAATYASWAPEGYAFRVVKEPGADRAAPDGTTQVVFEAEQPRNELRP